MPRAPPTKSIRLSVRTSAMPSSGCEQPILQHAHVERGDRIVARRSGARHQRRPSTGEVHGNLAATGGRCGSGADGEMLAHGGHERLRRSTRQILDDTVVGQHLDLVVWKRDGQHSPAAGAVAEVRSGDSAAAHLSMSARGAGRPVMSVGDVEDPDVLERVDQTIPIRSADTPERVPDAVRRLKVDERRTGCRAHGDRAHLCRRPIDEEDRAGLRPERQHVPGPIVFLVASRPLVLLDRRRARTRRARNRRRARAACARPSAGGRSTGSGSASISNDEALSAAKLRAARS